MPPPDRWQDYSKIGSVIPGTQIVCFKVPLKRTLLRDVPKDSWFTPEQLIDAVQESGHTLRMVIDLTFTTKYYIKDDFTSKGVQHLKVFTEGHVIPKDDVVYRFFDAVETGVEENPEKDSVIGVHCTHGINRTGYMVCRYMIERLAFDPQEAITAFNTARGHAIERGNYIADLHKRSHNPGYKNQGRHKLEHTKPSGQHDRKYHTHANSHALSRKEAEAGPSSGQDSYVQHFSSHSNSYTSSSHPGHSGSYGERKTDNKNNHRYTRQNSYTDHRHCPYNKEQQPHNQGSYSNSAGQKYHDRRWNNRVGEQGPSGQWWEDRGHRSGNYSWSQSGYWRVTDRRRNGINENWRNNDRYRESNWEETNYNDTQNQRSWHNSTRSYNSARGNYRRQSGRSRGRGNRSGYNDRYNGQHSNQGYNRRERYSDSNYPENGYSRHRSAKYHSDR